MLCVVWLCTSKTQRLLCGRRYVSISPKGASQEDTYRLSYKCLPNAVCERSFSRLWMCMRLTHQPVHRAESVFSSVELFLISFRSVLRLASHTLRAQSAPTDTDESCICQTLWREQRRDTVRLLHTTSVRILREQHTTQKRIVRRNKTKLETDKLLQCETSSSRENLLLLFRIFSSIIFFFLLFYFWWRRTFLRFCKEKKRGKRKEKSEEKISAIFRNTIQFRCRVNKNAIMCDRKIEVDMKMENVMWENCCIYPQ